jgi:TonB family protein
MLLRVILCSLLVVWGPCLAAQEGCPVKAAVAPQYPPIAVLARLSGSVAVRVVVDQSGNVTQADATKGHPVLKKAAREAAKKWKFEIAPAPSRTTLLEFDFKVLPEKSDLESETTFMPPNKVEVRKRPPESTVSDRTDLPGPH